jgi:GNAT superfamily N-acetyltransferase
MSHDPASPFVISNSPTKEEIQRTENLVESYNREQTKGAYDQPGIEISVVAKDPEGTVVGGVNASTMLRVMHLEVLWVADEYRKFGYGSDLVLAAERIGFEKGCLSSHTWTFAFQAPGFYPKIGYELLGIYDGYPDGLTEHVFMKRLGPHYGAQPGTSRRLGVRDSRGFSLTDEVTKADLKILHAGLHHHVKQNVGDEDKGIKIHLVIRDQGGAFVGGLYAWTTLRNMILENLWVEEPYRGQGLGRKMVLEAEKIAKAQGCIASQAYSFSFQAPGFFQKMGYEVLGVSDGYPEPVKEYYLIKKYGR